MDKQKAKQQVTWGELADIARHILMELFQSNELDPALKTKAKYAATVLASASRHEVTEVLQERQAIEVGVRLIEDREALIEFIKTMSPRLRAPLDNADIPSRVKALTETANKLAVQTLAAQDAVAAKS